MFSIYTSIYHIEKHNFPWKQSAENFVKFVGDEGEVVFAVNKSEDNTLKILQEFASAHKNVKIVETDFSYDDITMDGKIKNAALQATTKKLKIQMDCDEIIPLSNRDKWVEYGKKLLESKYDCFLLPTVDVFGDINKIRASQNIGVKFRLHKEGFYRGVWKNAWRGDKINTSMSDTCELITEFGDLAHGVSICDPIDLHPLFCSGLTKYPYTIHLGYLSFEHRININNKLWKEHWEKRSGQGENVATEKQSLEKEITIEHGLPTE